MFWLLLVACAETPPAVLAPPPPPLPELPPVEDGLSGEVVYPRPFRYPEGVHAWALSPDDRELFVALSESIHRTRVDTGAQERVLESPCPGRNNRIDDMATSPDGRRLAVLCGNDRMLHVVDLETQAARALPFGKRDSVEWGSDGLIALWDDDDSILILDPDTGKELMSHEMDGDGFVDEVDGVWVVDRIFADGDYLTMAWSRKKGELWRRQRADEVALLDRRVLVHNSTNQTVLLDLRTGRELGSWTLHDIDAARLLTSAEGVWYGGRGEAKRLNRDGEAVATLPRTLHRLEASPSGRWLVEDVGNSIVLHGLDGRPHLPDEAYGPAGHVSGFRTAGGRYMLVHSDDEVTWTDRQEDRTERMVVDHPEDIALRDDGLAFVAGWRAFVRRDPGGDVRRVPFDGRIRHMGFVASGRYLWVLSERSDQWHVHILDDEGAVQLRQVLVEPEQDIAFVSAHWPDDLLIVDVEGGMISWTIPEEYR